jgi:hypothetical protein
MDIIQRWPGVAGTFLPDTWVYAGQRMGEHVVQVYLLSEWRWRTCGHGVRRRDFHNVHAALVALDDLERCDCADCYDVPF